MIRLASPGSLAAIVLLAPVVWIWWRASRRPAAICFTDLALFDGAGASWRVRLRHLPRLVRVAFALLAVAALARPQYGVRSEEVTTRGVDIVIALDRSGSMRALDLTPDRLTVAKRTINEFASGRPADRLGLVLFAREAYAACPLTLDHVALRAMVDDAPFARQDEDGTAIGLGLASAVNRLKASDAESRVVVLVTDGVNNAGSIAPTTAADLARSRKIRVYTIGIGTHGYAQMPVIDTMGRTRLVAAPVEIDEESLRSIAERTGGRYFRADEEGKLGEIFAMIDRLEKTERTSEVYVAWSDRFESLLLAAGLALLAELFVLRPALGWLP